MKPPGSQNWQFAGRIEGQGIRQIQLGGRVLLVVEIDNDVWVIDAACSACGQIHTPQSCEGQTIICAHCGISQLIPGPGSDQRLPVMVTDNEIYVLLATGSGNS